MLIDAVTQTTSGHVYILYGNDDIIVGAGVTLTSTDTDAITTWSGQHVFTVHGQIFSGDDCINTIGCEAAQVVEIAVEAVLNAGYTGVVEDSDGVILDGVGSSLVNRGTINAHGSGVQVFARDGGSTTVANLGTIVAEKYGIWNKFGSGVLEFSNGGTIESGLGSYRGGDHVDHVTNFGRMVGDVDLGGGDDLYIGTAGTVVGQILGGSGNDRFVTGTSAEAINGGDGADLLDFSALIATTGVTVDLATPSLNRGATVAGDTYSGIENIAGSERADVLTGSATDNLLIGNGGHDTLSGGGGNDTLVGGRGTDVLAGGSGADVFVFDKVLERGDRIVDFQTTVDLIRLEGSAFGFGTYAGALVETAFRSGTTNAALDASDRLVFRTTDATLWYDRDGSGTRAAVMIADLADGLTVNFWDVTLI